MRERKWGSEKGPSKVEEGQGKKEQNDEREMVEGGKREERDTKVRKGDSRRD